MDVIRINRLVVRCRIGVYPEERIKPRNVPVNIALSVDLRKAGKTDNLADTIDYSRLAREILEETRGASFLLLEALAGRIAHVCLRDARVAAATVAVAKSGAPGVPGAGVEVELTRRAKSRRST